MALGQLGDPVILRVLGKSIAVTLVIFLISAAVLAYGFSSALGFFELPFDGALGTFLAIVAVIFAGWLWFRLVALFVLQFFIGEIVIAIQTRHGDAPARPLSMSEEAPHALRAAGRALALNALALPIAAVLIFTAIGPGIVFFAVNALLLGREFTDMAWLHRREPAAAGNPVSQRQRALLGAIIAGLMLVPLVQLLAPVIGALAGTHLTKFAMRSDAGLARGLT